MHDTTTVVRVEAAPAHVSGRIAAWLALWWFGAPLPVLTGLYLLQSPALRADTGVLAVGMTPVAVGTYVLAVSISTGFPVVRTAAITHGPRRWAALLGAPALLTVTGLFGFLTGSHVVAG